MVVLQTMVINISLGFIFPSHLCPKGLQAGTRRPVFSSSAASGRVICLLLVFFYSLARTSFIIAAISTHTSAMEAGSCQPAIRPVVKPPSHAVV